MIAKGETRSGIWVWCCRGVGFYCCHRSLLTRVDSAEADKVGSQRFRFCAYAGCAFHQGVRHRRTTLGGLLFVLH
jgi:hypothetical protein